MIDRQELLSDLQDLLKRLEADLLDRSDSTEVPEVDQSLRGEYEKAKQAERTAHNYEDWRSDYITQVAAAWVFSCVFVRFLEDNRLIDPPRIAGPADQAASGGRLHRARDEHEIYFRKSPTETDREYLLAVFDVPKERWVSFPHCEGEDGTLMIAWAGYDYLQLARAISAYYVDIQERLGGRDDPRLEPLIAGLIELLPWLKQWHSNVDAEFNVPMGDYFEGFIQDEAHQMNKTVEEIKNWQPPQRTSRRRKRAST